MIIQQATIYQKQRPLVEKVWRVLDKAKNPGFNGLIIAECPDKATASKIAGQGKTITAQAKTIKELSASLELAIRYLEHPDVQAMPFALHPSAVVERAKAVLQKAQL